MVIKKDPYAVLDMLRRPVPMDEDDEFLDNLEKKTSFYDLPDKPPEDLSKVAPVMNEQQEAMLKGLVDAEVEEEYLDGHKDAPVPEPPQELDEKHRSFFNLFRGVNTSKSRGGASLPDEIEFEKIHTSENVVLPRVGDTEEEKEAKAEDLERRQQWIEHQAKLDQNRKGSAVYEENKKKFLAEFDTVLEKR